MEGHTADKPNLTVDVVILSSLSLSPLFLHLFNLTKSDGRILNFYLLTVGETFLNGKNW